MNVDWYVASKFRERRRADGELGLWPAGTTHAKRIGESVAACGESALAMTKFFHLPFPFGEDACVACAEVVEEDRRIRVSSGGRRA